MLTLAKVYADLVEYAFDVHRRMLYEALRWPTPKDPASEWQAGQEVTQYLWRGSDQSYPIFTDQPSLLPAEPRPKEGQENNS